MKPKIEIAQARSACPPFPPDCRMRGSQRDAEELIKADAHETDERRYTAYQQSPGNWLIWRRFSHIHQGQLNPPFAKAGAR